MDLRKIQNLALMLFFFSLNFEVYDPLNTGGSFSVAKLTGLIYLVTVLPELFLFLRLDGLKKFLRPLWTFFLLLVVMSAIHANVRFPHSFDRTVFQNLILFWILVNHERYEPGIIEKGFLSFALGSVLLALFYDFGIGIGYSGTRLTIFGDNQNAVGMRMCLSMIVLVVNVFQNRLELGRIRYVLLLPIPLMIQLMAATQSRVSFVAFILSFLAGIWLLKTNKIWGKLVVLVVGAALLVGIWHLIINVEGMRLRLLQSIHERDLSGREDIWATIIPLIRENIVFGVGRTGYDYFTESVWGIVKSPHNVILEVVAMTGLVGLVFYLTFYIRSVAVSFRVYRESGMILPLLLMIPIFGLLMSGQLIDVKTAWVIFAYVVGCEILDEYPEEEFNPEEHRYHRSYYDDTEWELL
jgi:O-antigen ligase